MSYHHVEYNELEDYHFEQLICSSHPKKLTVFVWPSAGHMYYKIYQGKEVVVRCNDLLEAVKEYNKL